MVDIGKILLHGAILSGLVSLLLMSAVYCNPRFARRGLPRDIKEKVLPLTKEEKRLALLFVIPFFVLVNWGSISLRTYTRDPGARRYLLPLHCPSRIRRDVRRQSRRPGPA